MAEGARVSRGAAGSLWQAEFWPARAKDGAARIAEALGGTPPAPGASLSAGGARLWRAGPVIWRLMGAEGAPPDALAWIGPEDGAVAEIGPGWDRLEIRGPAARELMARAVTLDLREAAFPEGSVAATGHRHVAVTVIRPEGGGYDLLVPRSHGKSFAEALARQAARLG
jgi:sarcosine oxidase subunit gamma